MASPHRRVGRIVGTVADSTGAVIPNAAGYYIVSKLPASTCKTTAQGSGLGPAELPVIDTASAAIGTNVNSREVGALPLNGRQLSQLCLLAPGAGISRIFPIVQETKAL